MKKLAGMRATMGLSQKEVAKSLGITQTTISGWERHSSKPTADKVSILATLYNVTVQDIIDACTHTSIIPKKEASQNDEIL